MDREQAGLNTIDIVTTNSDWHMEESQTMETMTSGTRMSTFQEIPPILMETLLSERRKQILALELLKLYTWVVTQIATTRLMEQLVRGQ